MKYVLIPMAVFGVVAAKSERFIIQYDEQAWNAMSLKYLPTDTKYILKALRMQVADLDLEEIRVFSNLPGVTLHKDGVARIVDFETKDAQKDPPSWGIDRIDQRALPLDKTYNWDTTGKGVDVWIVDTGVNAAHQEFGGRATFDKNFAEDGKDTDCHGHGTHVSSTIGGKTVGVAKEATIHGVKVLDCGGSGSWSGVIAGINYVVEESKKGNKKSVINMSLGGPKNEAVNAAVKAATEGGVTVVVAAGNESQNANNVSPASAPEAITVAASDISDSHAYFSNYGPNVALYAPGVNIKGAWIGGTSSYNTISGTSMASPHTAGVAALVIARGEASNPAQVKERLQAAATKDVIKGVKPQTKNLLLYSLKASGVATYDSYNTNEVMNLVK